jgi:mono/diheme cytochrome c family protein
MKELLARINTKEALNWWQKSVLTALAVQGKNKNNSPTTLDAAPEIFGRKEVDKRQAALLQSAANLFAWEGHQPHQKTATDQAALSDDDQRLFATGRQHYLTTCAGCHGTDGAGLPRFGPPLAESAWVLGDEKRLSLIVLHGMEGPLEVNGKQYDVPDILPVMPSHSTMDDGAITAILVYIRNEWGNNAGGLSRGIVSKTRHTSQGRVVPWTAKELLGK